MRTAEREKIPVVKERVGEIEVPESLKETGIRKVETAYKSTVQDDQGKPLVQDPSTKKVSIQIPQNEELLKTSSKGKISNSLTWFARFWLRMVKKALFLGKKVEVKNK